MTRLIPAYEKPMTYYPLAVSMLAIIREILIIITADSPPPARRLGFAVLEVRNYARTITGQPRHGRAQLRAASAV